MSNRPALFRRVLLVFVTGLMLSACENSGDRGLAALRLPACSADGSIFKEKKYSEWKDFYHKQVDKVVEAHMKAMNESGNQPLQCTKADESALVPASGALKETAAMLPAWKNRADELKESDMQAVLLEFLRVYECSMDEQSLFIPVRIRSVVAMPNPTSGDLSEQQTKIRDESDREKILAREALNRTLSLVSGFDRLQPLMLDIECLKRSSLDLRNVLGLASDISSCLPRIWDAKGSLRDLEEEPE